MSIKVMTAVWELEEGLTGIEKAILLKLADYGSNSGHSIYPGLRTLERKTSFHRNTIIKSIKSLQQKGFIEKSYNYGEVGQQLNNNYRILISKLGLKDEQEGGTPHVPRGYTTETGGDTSRVSLDPLVNNHELKQKKEKTKKEKNPSQPKAELSLSFEDSSQLNPKLEYETEKEFLEGFNYPKSNATEIGIPPTAKIMPLKRNTEAKEKLSEVERVFLHWKAKMGFNGKTILSPDRKKKILQALQHYSMEELEQAINGCTKSDFHMGKNDRNTKYNDISQILKSTAHIEKFIELDKEASKPKPKTYKGVEYK